MQVLKLNFSGLNIKQKIANCKLLLKINKTQVKEDLLKHLHLLNSRTNSCPRHYTVLNHKPI